MASSSSTPRLENDTEMTDLRIERLIEQSQYAEAAEVGRQLLEKSRSAPELDDQHTSSATTSFGTALHQLLKSREETLGSDHPNTIAVLHAISEGLCRTGRYKDSIKMLDEELRRCERAFGQKHELTIKTLKHMGQVYIKQGDPHLASSVLLRAMELSQSLYGLDHMNTTLIHRDLCRVRGANGSLALEHALSAMHGLPIPGDPFASMVSMSSGDLLRKYKGVSALISGGTEVLNRTAMQLSDQLRQPRQPPIMIPSAFEDNVESSENESDEDEDTDPSKSLSVAQKTSQ
jgi:tetratricopeptide (TPR) repeat protein